jgi:hypothetical protein
MSRSIDLGRLRFYHRGTYGASASYELNDVVSYGGSSYVYVNPTVTTGNAPTSTTYWAKMAEGFDVRGAWATSTNYFLNDIVTYGNSVYICTTIHTSGLFDTDRVASYWELLVEGTNWRGTWATSTGYFSGDVVAFGNYLYVAEVNHTSGTFSTDLGNNKWSLQTKGFDWESAWATSTSYDLNDVVTYGAYVYVCVEAHTSGTFVTDLAASKWELLTTGIRWRGTYALSTSYLEGDAVFYGGNTYLATDTFTSDATSFDNDTDWTLLAQGALSGEIAVQTGNAGKYLTTNGTTTAWTSELAADEVTANIYLYAGSSAEGFSASAGLTNPVIVGQADANNYAQISFVNLNSGADASTDFIAYANNGDDDSGWIDMGITSSSFSDPAFSLTGENDGYIFMEAPSGTTGDGNLVIATGTNGVENSVVIAAGGLTSGTEQLKVTPSGIEVIGDINSQGELNVAGTGILTVGDDAQTFKASATLTNPVAVFSVDENDYAQISFVNVNSGSDASADFIAYADNGDDASGWIDMGITSSTFSDPEFSSTGINDGYIFMEAPVGTSGKGNLVIATGGNGSENKIVFAAGGLLSDNEQMSITPDTNVHIEIATESTSPSTGALTVVGGVGTQGNMNVLGDVTINGSLTIFGGAFEAETVVSTTPIFVVGEEATENTSDRGFLAEYKASLGSASVVFDIGTFASSASVGVVTRKGYASAFKAVENSIATITFVESHSIQAGETVTVTGLGAPFDGTFTVATVGVDTITYSVTSGNITQVADTGGFVQPDVPTGIVNGDSLIIAGSGVSGLNGTKNFVASASGASVSFDFTGPVAPTNTSGTATVNTRTKYAGLIRDDSDGTWNLVANVPSKVVGSDYSKPTDTVNLSDGDLVFPNLKVGGLVLPGTPEITGNPDFTGNPTFSGNPAFSASAVMSGTFSGNGTFTGNPTFSGSPIFSGNPSFTGTPSFSGGVRVQEMIEDVVDASISANVITVSYTNGNIVYVTNTPAADFSFRITDVPTDNGRITTINLIVTQGATGYKPTSLWINNVAQTLRWAANVIPTPTSSAGKIDIFTFSLLRRSDAYIVLGSANLNF